MEMGKERGNLLQGVRGDRRPCLYSGIKRTFMLLPRDAMRKRGPCCRPVSVCPSVCLSSSCIVSRQLKIS